MQEGEGGSQHGMPRWVLLVLGVLGVAGIMAIVAGGESRAVFETSIYALWIVPILVAAWMLGIALTGPFARRGLFDDSRWPDGWRSLVAAALGLGCLSLGMLLLGSLHLLIIAGSPWGVAILPAAAAAVGFLPTRRFLQGADRRLLASRGRGGDWLLLLAVVPIGMLMVAATFPPGTLWASEARGYDVMEYHLEMPREYAANNSTAPVAHNVYSYFPANVEMLYLLLMQLAKGVMGDPSYLWGTFPSQFLHVALMVMTAAALVLMPGGRGSVRTTGRAVAALVFLGIPWTIITGSLAYNEGGMLLFGTLALGLALGGGEGSKQSSGAPLAEPAAAPPTGAPTSWALRGVLIGAMLGLSLGCKQTAGLFFAAPVGLLLLLRAAGDGRALKGLVLAVVVSAAVYAPWAVRAAAASGGNPVFPLASAQLGRNDWTPEQSAMFDRGHQAPASEKSLAGRYHALVRSLLLDNQWSPALRSIYVWTKNPPPDDALWRRFGLLWLVVPLGIALALIRPAGRGTSGLLLAALGVQLLAWMFFTHLQSRFLLPIAVPLALLLGRGAQGAVGRAEGLLLGGIRVLVATGVTVQAMCTIFLLLPEVGLLGGTATVGAGGAARQQPIGDLFSRQVNVAAMAWVAAHPGAEMREEPPPEKVLLVGDATAWHYPGEGATGVVYSTVFNRSPLSEALAQKDPAVMLHLLQERRIHFVLINWSEVDRLRKTYGFDPAITPDALGRLKQAGLVEIPLEALGLPGLTLLRVP
jgi:hypothetical protein